MKPRVVLDTNVLVSALRSRRGASFKVLSLVGAGKYAISISVPLVFEYEEAAMHVARSAGLSRQDVNDILDYICRVAEHRRIFFLWRPFLRDPSDDMVLELAVESRSRYIVTHNVDDFAGIEHFGLRALRPGEFLRVIGESK
jgi:putative PIN family toxin of toxin-antitoxin system